jgi:site-specific recombinase XerD
LIFANGRGELWSREAYKSWEGATFKRAAESAGYPRATPYTLRHSYASLLIHSGLSVVEVAARLGHAPTMTLDTYAHVFAELSERRPVELEIAAARSDAAAMTTKRSPSLVWLG